MQALNFFRKAKEEIKNKVLDRVRPEYEQTKAEITEWLEIGSRAQKFVLPLGGRIVNDGLKGLPQEIRLPYPEIVLEYEVQPGTISVSEMEFGKEGTAPFPKRILIAKQVNPTQIVLAAMVFNSDTQSWMILPYLKAILIGKEWGSRAENIDYLSNHKKEVQRDDLYATYRPLAGYEKNLPPNWPKAATIDFVDETRALLELIEALSCSNVGTQVLPTRQKLNKGALKRGALPFDDYRILVIKNKQAGSTEEWPMFEEIDTRCSPREHLRRGHRRTYASGVSVWIQSTVVNPGTRGKINKDYLVQKMK